MPEFGAEVQLYHQLTPGESTAMSSGEARSYATPRFALLAGLLDPEPVPGGAVPDPGGVVPDPGGVVPEPGGVVPEPDGVVPDSGGVVPVPGGVGVVEGGVVVDPPPAVCIKPPPLPQPEMTRQAARLKSMRAR
jgi:hypothetical protein